jgi:hypothetical protein
VVTIPLCDLPDGLPCGGRAPSICLVLLRMGFTKPHESLRMLVRSYRTVSPLPVTLSRPSAVCSLLHCPSGFPDLALASTLPCEAPTFLSVLLRRGHPNDSPSLASVRTAQTKGNENYYRRGRTDQYRMLLRLGVSMRTFARGASGISGPRATCTAFSGPNADGKVAIVPATTVPSSLS